MVNKYPLLKILLVILVFIFVYGLGLIPCIFFHFLVTVPLFNSQSWLNVILAGLSLGANFIIFCFSEVFVTAFFVNALGLRSKEGVAEVGLHDPLFLRFVIQGAIHSPITQLLYHLHMYSLKTLHLRLMGAKIGQNVTMGGRVIDASLFEAGDNVNIGGYSDILTHSMEEGKIIWKRVRIGSKCTVGQNTTILPGAVMEEGSVLGAMSLLPKDKRIPKGEVWGGVPAKKIK